MYECIYYLRIKTLYPILHVTELCFHTISNLIKEYYIIMYNQYLYNEFLFKIS